MNTEVVTHTSLSQDAGDEDDDAAAADDDNEGEDEGHDDDGDDDNVEEGHGDDDDDDDEGEDEGHGGDDDDDDEGENEGHGDDDDDDEVEERESLHRTEMSCDLCCSDGACAQIKLREATAQWRTSLEPGASWRVLFLCIVPVKVILGTIFMTEPIFYVAYVTQFPDDSYFTIGWIFSTKLAVMSVIGMVTSVMISRFGERRVCVAGGCIMTLSLILSTVAPNTITLCFTQGLGVGVGSGMLDMSVTYYGQRVFPRNRMLCEGLGMLGVSVGSVVGPALANFLLDTYGWRGSLLLLAALALHSVPVSLIITSYPQTDDVTASTPSKSAKILAGEVCDWRLFGRLQFSLIALSVMLDKYCVYSFMQHLPNRAVHLGMSRADGATLLSAASMSILACRVAVTWLGNFCRVSRVGLFSLGALVGGIDSLVLVPLRTFTGHMVMAVINGPHIGITNTVNNVMLVDMFGVDTLPRAMALCNVTSGLATISAAPIGGLLADWTGSYDAPYLVSGCAGVLAAVCGFAAAYVDLRSRRRARHAPAETNPS